MHPCPDLHKPDSALILLGHGSTMNADSSAPTRLHAEEIRRRGVFREVVCGFWKEKPGFREVLDLVESRDVYIVPNFISEGYFTQKIIPREMGLLGLPGAVTVLPGRAGVPERTLKYCKPAGNHPRMTELLLHRAREAAPGVDPGLTSLVIVGHGTSLDENSGLAVTEQVAQLRARNEYAEVLGMYLEQEPYVKDWPGQTCSREVVVVPFFISDGLHSYQQIPALLGIETAGGEAEVFRHNPYEVGGRRVYYSGAIGTDALFARVILDQVLEFDREYRGHVAQQNDGNDRGDVRDLEKCL